MDWKGNPVLIRLFDRGIEIDEFETFTDSDLLSDIYRHGNNYGVKPEHLTFSVTPIKKEEE